MNMEVYTIRKIIRLAAMMLAAQRTGNYEQGGSLEILGDEIDRLGDEYRRRFYNFVKFAEAKVSHYEQEDHKAWEMVLEVFIASMTIELMIAELSPAR